jgi:hypothetical protein
MIGQLFQWGRLIMPTDLPPVSAQKRKAQARAQGTFNAVVLISFIICLAVLALLVFNQSFSKAVVELMTLF